MKHYENDLHLTSFAFVSDNNTKADLHLTSLAFVTITQKSSFDAFLLALINHLSVDKA